MQHDNQQPIVVVVASRQAEAHVRAYASMLTMHRPARIHNVYACPDDPFIVPWGYCEKTSCSARLGEAFRTITVDGEIGLIVSEWQATPCNMQEVLQQGHRLGVPVVVIRQPYDRPCGRILAATSGGPSVLQMMWVAREMAQALRLPVHLLRIVSPPVTAGHESTAALDASTCRLLRMEADIEVRRAEEVEDAIVESVRDGDMLVMGAPSAFGIASCFAGSLPHRIAGRVTAPVVLLSMPPDTETSLRTLLWGELIHPQVRFRDKNDALSSMIENLLRHNHIPNTSRFDLLERALRREAIMPTAMDCETAFPHIALNGFSGVTCCMAICPDGVDFGSPDGHLTRFICLLVTPDGFYDDYLATIALLARRMIRTEIRAGLLQCRTPLEALDILEPEDNSAPDSEAPPSADTGDFAWQPPILHVQS